MPIPTDGRTAAEYEAYAITKAKSYGIPNRCIQALNNHVFRGLPVGGFIAAVICAVVVRNLWLCQAMSVGMAAGIGALIGITGQLSDMAESMVKRSVGVKDSSNLLPGHGGVLDRFDSFLLSAPVLYYVLIFIG